MQKTHELFGMIHHLKNSMGFRVGDTESPWLNYISFSLFWEGGNGHSAHAGSHHDFYLNIIQGIHLDKKKTENFCSSLKEVWILMTVLYSIVLKDRHFNKIYIFDILFICVQLSNVLHIHLCVGEILRLKCNYFID